MSYKLLPYRKGPIEPVVEVGQNVLTVDREAYNLFQIAYIEPIPPSHPLVANVGAIAAGATGAVLNTQNILDMQYGQVGQFRARVLDDIHVTLLQPLAVTRFSTKNQVATINAFSALYDECDHLTEFFIYEDDRVHLRAVNPTGYALAQARVAFYGFRYVLTSDEGPAKSGGSVKPIARFLTIQEAIKSGHKFTVVPAGGWGR